MTYRVPIVNTLPNKSVPQNRASRVNGVRTHQQWPVSPEDHARALNLQGLPNTGPLDLKYKITACKRVKLQETKNRKACFLACGCKRDSRKS